MTVISALFTKKGVAVCSDSLLTVREPNGSYSSIEWKQSKIVKLKKFRGCISYWGYAGNLHSYGKTNKKPIWEWSIYKWLLEQCDDPSENSLEEFVKNLCEKLKVKFSKIKFKNNKVPGIGLYVIGYEPVKKYWIPELFLITNGDHENNNYSKVGELTYSRHTYKTIINDKPREKHKKKQFRMDVLDYLNRSKLIWYNNGDPELYNTVSNVISNSINIASKRGKLKNFTSLNDVIPIVKRPIEIIAKIQEDFYKPNMRLVGGTIHDLAITPSGKYISL